jgi:hypothetical protein
MMLTGRNEWIAIAILIAYIAFVPTPYALKEFLGSPIGKVVALVAVVYAWKFVSCPVAILLVVVFLRSGAMREYLDESGLKAPSAPTVSNDYRCADGFTYVTEKKTCMKGNESKAPECNDSSMTWDSSVASCVSKAGPGPSGGTTPGAMAAKNELANLVTPPPTTESFTPYTGKPRQEFAPL